MRVCIPLFLFGSLLAAQTVEVEVFDSLTGAPVAGASVIDNGAGNAVSRTDVAGHFRTTRTASPVISFGFTISRAGYLTAYPSIASKPNQSVTNVRIPLTPAAVISGKLVDEDGFPVDHANVQAMSYPVMDGERRLRWVVSAVSNDLGEYRLKGLSAGSYYIGVQPGHARNWDGRYVFQFIDGALQPGEKNLIEVKAGQERSGVDGTLAKHEGITVAGRVLVPDGVTARQLLVDVQDSVARNFSSALVQSDGAFQIRHLPPGSYTLRVHTQTQYGEVRAGDLLATSPLEVETSDMTGLLLAPHAVQPVDISGSVVQPGGGTLQPMTIMVHRSSGGSTSANSAEDGSFTLKGLLPGHYIVSAQPDYQAIRTRDAASIAFPSSARFGEKEVLESGFEVDGTSTGPLQITLKQPIMIAGQVVDGAGNPVPNAFVAVISQWGPQSSRISDAKGTFQFGLRSAGDYRIYAASDQALIPDFGYIKVHEKDSQAVRIVEGQNPPIVVRLPAR